MDKKCGMKFEEQSKIDKNEWILAHGSKWPEATLLTTLKLELLAKLYSAPNQNIIFTSRLALVRELVFRGNEGHSQNH